VENTHVDGDVEGTRATVSKNLSQSTDYVAGFTGCSTCNLPESKVSLFPFTLVQGKVKQKLRFDESDAVDTCICFH
jgi:hypothetical protein